jgi:hypothetical protein
MKIKVKSYFVSPLKAYTLPSEIQTVPTDKLKLRYRCSETNDLTDDE